MMNRLAAEEQNIFEGPLCSPKEIPWTETAWKTEILQSRVVTVNEMEKNLTRRFSNLLQKCADAASERAAIIWHPLNPNEIILAAAAAAQQRRHLRRCKYYNTYSA